MTGPEKLRAWRKNQAFSHRDLSSALVEKMQKDFPDGFGKGDKIHPSDISEAENAESPFKYKKVTDAVIRYFELPENFFGPFANLAPEEPEPISPEQRDDYRVRIIQLMDEIIQANQEAQVLRDEKFKILKKNMDLEKRILDLERELERLKK